MAIDYQFTATQNPCQIVIYFWECQETLTKFTFKALVILINRKEYIINIDYSQNSVASNIIRVMKYDLHVSFVRENRNKSGLI